MAAGSRKGCTTAGRHAGCATGLDKALRTVGVTLPPGTRRLIPVAPGNTVNRRKKARRAAPTAVGCRFALPTARDIEKSADCGRKTTPKPPQFALGKGAGHADERINPPPALQISRSAPLIGRTQAQASPILLNIALHDHAATSSGGVGSSTCVVWIVAFRPSADSVPVSALFKLAYSVAACGDKPPSFIAASSSAVRCAISHALRPIIKACAAEGLPPTCAVRSLLMRRISSPVLVFPVRVQDKFGPGSSD
jgi:hypothetical protein